MKDLSLTSAPWGFRMMPLTEQCSCLQKMELKYFCGMFADFPGAFPPDITVEDLDRSMEQIRSFGLEFASCNAAGDFMVSDGLEDEIALCCRQIDMAARLSFRVIIVFAGGQDRADEAVYDQVSSALKQVSRHAAKYGLTVAMENHGGPTRTADQINRILAGVGEDNIGVNYDPANFLMYGEDPLASLRKLDFPVAFTHLKSVKHKDGKKVYCRLEEGEIDYIPILEHLRDSSYDGFYALEYEEPSDVFAGSKDDLRTLCGWLDKVHSIK